MIRSSRDDIQYQPLPTVSPNMSPFRLKWSRLALFGVPVVLLIIILTAHLRQPSCNKAYLQDYTVQHVFAYCNGLSQETTGQEGTVPPSDGYKLETVYVVLRHGDRSNLHSIQNYKPPDLNCKVGDRIIGIEPKMKDYRDALLKQTKGFQENEKSKPFHQFDLYPSRPKCEAGELTPTGAAQHLRNGMFLNKRYVDAHNLFGTTKADFENMIQVRSTVYVRTFQSAVAFLYGFLPKLNMAQLEMQTAEYNPLCNEHSYTQCACPSISKYMDMMASTMGQFTPRVMAEKKTRDTYKHISEVFSTTVSQLPRPSHVFDVSMVHACHHQPLPGASDHRCMQPWALGNIYDIINDNGQSQVSSAQYQRIARLKMYPLLQEIKQHMVQQHTEISDKKLFLFVGHDSTVEPLATALNFSDGHWSRYASRIAIELYSKPSSEQSGGGGGKQLLIRVLYDGNLVTEHMHFCKGRMFDSQQGLCPLEHFVQYVDRDALADIAGGRGADYKKMCSETT